MGAHVHCVVQAFQRRLVASYKRQLGWDDERGEVPADTRPQTERIQAKDDRNRKPSFTLLARVTAVATAGVSVHLYSGAPSGF